MARYVKIDDGPDGWTLLIIAGVVLAVVAYGIVTALIVLSVAWLFRSKTMGDLIARVIVVGGVVAASVWG